MPNGLENNPSHSRRTIQLDKAFPTIFLKMWIMHSFQEGHTSIDEIDIITINFDENLKFLKIHRDPLIKYQSNARQIIGRIFKDRFQSNVREKLFFYDHHIAHLWTIFISNFDDAMVISIDGSGDGKSGLIASYRNHKLEILREHSINQSLGNFYTDSIRFLGFHRFDEGKAMGLAPYGNPKVFEKLFNQFYQLLPKGQFNLSDIRSRWQLIHNFNLIKEIRRPDEPFNQIHKDFAAGIQHAIETIVMHFLKHFQEETGHQNLCLTGGVAHNCSLNGKILNSGGLASNICTASRS